MKTLLLFLLAVGANVLADPAALAEPAAAPAAKWAAEPAPAAPVAEGWSVVGVWDCTHRDWNGPLTLKPDGAVLGEHGLHTGQWMLGAQGGQVVLLLRWNDWPAEAAVMLNADEFHGKADQGDLRMRRRLPAPAPAATDRKDFPAVEFRTWSQGEPPAKLIRQDEGFCALTRVQGNFQGSGESVQVHIAEDGYWYLDGRSHQKGVGAACVVVRFPGKPPEKSGKD